MAFELRRNRNSYFARLTLLKKLFWLYFLLLIFEGALRKWVAPQLSAPLLIIRDPISIWILWEAYRTRKWPRSWSAVIGILTLGVMALCAVQLVFENNPWFAAAYGLRSYLLPFPVAFIMGENLDGEDLRKFASFTLWILLPMTALEVAQYLSPVTAWINAGAYHGGSQIIYTGDHVRAAGTFSFDVGAIDMVALAAPFMIYGFLDDKFFKNKWLLWAAGVAIVLSVPVIGARTLVFELAGILGCVVIAASFGLSQMAKSLKIVFPLLAVCMLASFLPVFSSAMATLNTRFTQASRSEGDVKHVLLLRILDPLTGDIEDVDFSQHWIGMGMGRGAAAVTQLMNGAVSFAAGESASVRAINEMGPFPGSAYLLFCYLLGLAASWKSLLRARDHKPLPLLLAPAMLATLCFAILEQPTEQGFMVICVALSLAAIKLTAPSSSPIPGDVQQWTRLAAARVGRQSAFARRTASSSNSAASQ